MAEEEESPYKKFTRPRSEWDKPPAQASEPVEESPYKQFVQEARRDSPAVTIPGTGLGYKHRQGVGVSFGDYGFVPVPTISDLVSGAGKAYGGLEEYVKGTLGGERAPISKEGALPGTVPPDDPRGVEPGAVADFAQYLLNPTVAARRSLSPSARAAREFTAAGGQMPGYAAGGPIQRGVAYTLSRLPVGGGVVRESAERGLQSITEMGGRAQTMSAGQVVEPHVGGNVVQLVARRNAVNPLTGIADNDFASLVGANMSEETSLSLLANRAGSKRGADLNAFTKFRNAASPDEWSAIQGALVTKMGRGQQGTFDPAVFSTNYGNMSRLGRDRAFGPRTRGEPDDLRRSLDAIQAAEVHMAPMLKRFAKEPGLVGTGLGLAAVGATAARVAAGDWMAPLQLVSSVSGSNVVARMLSRPATADSLATWAGAYSALARRPGVMTLGPFIQATRDLQELMGEDFNVDTFLSMLPDVKISGLPPPNADGTYSVHTPVKIDREKAERNLPSQQQVMDFINSRLGQTEQSRARYETRSRPPSLDQLPPTMPAGPPAPGPLPLLESVPTRPAPARARVRMPFDPTIDPLNVGP